MSTICASGWMRADHAVADAHEVVVAAVVGEQGDDHRATSSTIAATRPSMSWRSASTCGSMPCSRRVALVTGPIETTRAAAQPPAALEEEAHGGAGGEGHVRGAGQRLALRRRAARRRCRRAPARPPRRRARAGRRAARRAPRPRAPPARACRPRLRLSASSRPSATKRSGTTSARMPCSRSSAAVPGPIAATCTPASARASAVERVEEEAHAVRAREADQRVGPRSGAASTARGSIRIAGVSSTSAPSAAQPRRQLARLRAGARDGHHLPVQRPPLEPGERVAQRRPPGRPR